MVSSPLRIATIGTWGHLGEPLNEIAQMTDATVVAHARAVADEDVPYVRKMTGGDERPWYDDYHHMLREVKPDVVIVSTRIDRINAIACDVAEARCHLICEKPLAIDHANLKRLHAIVMANKLQCAAMLGNARHPVMQAASGLIQAGKIGDVVLLNARKSYKWGNRPEWFGNRNSYGGTIPWVAIHSLEMIHHLSGREFVSVAAMQSNAAHADRPGCEDNGVIIFGLSGGAHGSVSFDILRPTAAATHGDDWVRIVGSTGVIEASLDRGSCKVITRDAAEQEMPLPAKGVYYAPFLRSLASGQFSADTRKAFMLTHVALCARDSADKKSVEEIPVFG